MEPISTEAAGRVPKLVTHQLGQWYVGCTVLASKPIDQSVELAGSLVGQLAHQSTVGAQGLNISGPGQYNLGFGPHRSCGPNQLLVLSGQQLEIAAHEHELGHIIGSDADQNDIWIIVGRRRDLVEEHVSSARPTDRSNGQLDCTLAAELGGQLPRHTVFELAANAGADTVAEHQQADRIMVLTEAVRFG